MALTDNQKQAIRLMIADRASASNFAALSAKYGGMSDGAILAEVSDWVFHKNAAHQVQIDFHVAQKNSLLDLIPNPQAKALNE